MLAATRIFLRDDDVSTLSTAFVDFFAIFKSANLPVSYQVIPETLDDACAEFLRGELEQGAGLVEIGQHGLRHQMIVNGKLEFYEFGPERTFQQQLDDILAGKALLRDRLGADVSLDVFTPPRHRYDRNTLKAIRQAGYSVLSASSYTSWRHRAVYAGARMLGLTNLGRPGIPRHGGVRPDSGLFELSVAVGVDDGSRIMMTVDQAMAGIDEARRHTRDVGVLLHHEAFKGAEGATFLAAFIARLKALPSVTFHTIGDLHRHYARTEAP